MTEPWTRCQGEAKAALANRALFESSIFHHHKLVNKEYQVLEKRESMPTSSFFLGSPNLLAWFDVPPFLSIYGKDLIPPVFSVNSVEM